MAALATLPAILTLASAGVSAVGTIAAGRQAQAQADIQASIARAGAESAAQQAKLQARAAEVRGEAALAESEFRATQLEHRGRDEAAAAQFDAREARRKTGLALSRVQARSAASGFTATDPTTLNLTGQIEEQGALRERILMFGGLSRQAGLRDQAAAEIFSGRSANTASQTEAKLFRHQGRTHIALGKGEAAARRQEGRAARTGSYFKAGSTILGGAATASMRAKYG